MPAGRPPTETNKIDAAELEKLMKLCISDQEAADWFDVNPRTLDRFIRKHFGCNFVQFHRKRFTKTRIAIKRAQIDKALKGDNTMLIWCGKQYLGQRDKNSNEISGPDGKPIEIDDRTKLSDAELDALIAAKTAKLKL